MDNIFLNVLNLSFYGGFAILLMLILRFFIKKLPTNLSFTLWVAVFVKLVVPFTFKSPFTLLPVNHNTIPPDLIYQNTPAIDSGIKAIDNAVNQFLPPATPYASMNPIQVDIFIFSNIWLIGVLTIWVYSVFSLLKLYLKLKDSENLRGNIYLLSDLETPFVCGFIKPKIYMPNSLAKDQFDYILLHEQMHIKRFDHIFKLFAFGIATIHWFNPLVWVAFYLMIEDMEKSCDEAVIIIKGSSIKTDYSNSLLQIATEKNTAKGYHLAFGENNTKSRILNVLNYKKPAFWVTAFATVLVAFVVFGLFSSKEDTIATPNDMAPMIMVNDAIYLDTGRLTTTLPETTREIGALILSESLKPATQNQGVGLAQEYNNTTMYLSEDGFIVYIKSIDKEGYFTFHSETTSPSVGTPQVSPPNDIIPLSTDLGKSIDMAILTKTAEHNFTNGEARGAAHYLFDYEEKEGKTHGYILARYMSFGFENGIFTQKGGFSRPITVIFTKDSDGNYILEDYIESKDGSYYYSSVEEMFSEKALKLWQDKEGKGDFHAALDQQCYEYAKDYLKSIGRDAKIQERVEKINITGLNDNALQTVYKKYSWYPYWIGTSEAVENGERYIYTTDFAKTGELQGVITYTKTNSKGVEVEKIIVSFNGDTVSISENGNNITVKINS